LGVAHHHSVEPVAIQGSRRQAAVLLAASLAITAVFAWLIAHSSDVGWAWIGLASFGFSSLVQLWLYVRPQVLRLDSSGFTLSGGLIWAPQTISWQEIEGFFVHRVRDGQGMGETELIGFNFAPGARKRSFVRGVFRRLGAEHSRPSGWPEAPEEMVAELNTYRQRALAVSTGEPALGNPAT
jgi:hypothetical protein